MQEAVIFQQTIVPFMASLLTWIVPLAGLKWFEIFVRVQNLHQIHFAKIALDGVTGELKREIKAVAENGKTVEVPVSWEIRKCTTESQGRQEHLECPWGLPEVMREFPAFFDTC